jgi:3-oxoadipate enol-lactonase
MESVINGTKLYYSDTGNANSAHTIVLIHGFPFSHEMWKPQVEFLKEKFRVVTYDIRGHGKSDVGDGQYALEFFVDDLVGLLDHLSIEKAIVCGLSMGGYVALRAAERSPERFKALILCDTSSLPDSNEAKLKRASQVKAIKAQGLEAFTESFLKAVFTQQSITSKLEFVKTIRDIILSNSSIGICGTLLALACRTDTTPSLSKINIPTLILVGEHDAITTPQTAQMMHDNIRNSKLHIIGSAAHMSNLENTNDFNRHLDNFLRNLE